MTKPVRFNWNRRGFLRTAGVLGAGLASSLWFPRAARGTSPVVKRLIIVHCPGGVRWSATFDGFADPSNTAVDLVHNPWVNLNTKGGPWSALFPGATAPTWGFSSMLLQVPQYFDLKSWKQIYGYITTFDPNTIRSAPVLLSKQWSSAKLPSVADVAHEIAVVRNTGSPGQQFDADHGSASRTLFTGKHSGTLGLVTAIHYAMRRVMGDDSAFNALYPLPPVVIGQAAWSFGVGAYAAYRPIVLSLANNLPTTDPSKTIAPWGAKAEIDSDTALADTRQAFMGQSIADYMNDKAAGDSHGSQLVDPSLHLYDPTAGSAHAPLDPGGPTNDMLNELFGVTSAAAPPGDILFDAFAAVQSTAKPTWKAGDNAFGLNGALAVRLLEAGAPIVSITQGQFDSHSGKVIDPQLKRSHPVPAIELGRLLAALSFALKAAKDPQGQPLWDSTVIVCCSEFGRGVQSKSITNGFNNADGSNDGGSDHDPWAGWPVMGGPVAAGGQLLLADASSANPARYYAQNQVFSTILAGMGVDAALNAKIVTDDANFPLATDQFAPIVKPGLIKGVM